MVIDNQTEEPVVYSTKDGRPAIPKRIRIFLSLAMRVLAAFWLWPFRGRLGNRAASHKPMGEMCLPGRGLCTGMLMVCGEHQIKSTYGYSNLTVTVYPMSSPWASAWLENVDGKDDVLEFKKAGNKYELVKKPPTPRPFAPNPKPPPGP